MRRHEFEPGKLVAGLFLLAAGVVYGLDGLGAWDVPAFVLVPMVAGGLSLAWVAAAYGHRLERRDPRRDDPRQR